MLRPVLLAGVADSAQGLVCAPTLQRPLCCCPEDHPAAGSHRRAGTTASAACSGISRGAAAQCQQRP